MPQKETVYAEGNRGQSARSPQYGAVEAGRGQVKAMGDRWVTALSSMQQLCVTAAAIVSCSSPMLSVIDDGGRLLVLFIRGECSAAVASNLLPLKGVGKQQRQISEARQHYRCNKEANDVFILIPTHYIALHPDRGQFANCL